MFVSDRAIIGLILFCCLVSVALPVRSQDSPTAYIGNDIEGLTKEEMFAAAVPKIKKVVPILEKHKKMII